MTQQFSRRAFLATAACAVATKATGQVSTITDAGDIEAAYEFAQTVAQNEDLLRVAGLWSVTGDDWKQDNFFAVLNAMREGFSAKTQEGKAVVAYCVSQIMVLNIAPLSQSVKNRVVGRASNGKNITIGDFGSTANDFANGLNKGLYDGQAKAGNCHLVFNKYLTP